MSAGVLIAPSIGIAQGTTRVHRIGDLWPGVPTPDFERRGAEALRELGWVEGQNLQVERRYANGRPEQLQPLAEELVRERVEIIVTGGTPATLAAKRATNTIPIVFVPAGDPVLTGLVASLARPGGNVTGFSLAGPEVSAKRLSVLKELLPRLQRVGALLQTGNPDNRVIRTNFERACQSLRLVPIIVEIEVGQIDGIEQLARQNAQALLLEGGAVGNHADEFVDAATKRRLPTMSDARREGALISYGVTWAELFRRRAEYIDSILRGAKPADLPVQQPTKFELVINLKAAKALGITIPQSLLVRADEVIQ